MPIQRHMPSGLLSKPDLYAAVVSLWFAECFAITPSKPGRPCRNQAGGSGARDPGIHNLFQIADVDLGVIRWVNADLVSHVIPDC